MALIYRYRRLRLLLLTALISFCFGCSSARLDQFYRFAQAGMAYTQSVDSLLTASVKTGIETDNRLLLKIRELNSDPEGRTTALDDFDAETKRRLEIHNALRVQTRLLEAYFLALGVLAARDEKTGLPPTASSLGESAKDLATALSEGSKDLAKAKVGDQKVADFLGQVVPIVVASYQRADLDDVLAETAPIVDRAIDVHMALLRAIRAQLVSDLDLIAKDNRTRLIVGPYKSSDPLPEDWGKHRLDWFTQQQVIIELDQAVAASQKLELAFVALIENIADTASFDLLIQDLNRLTALAKSLDG